VNRRASVSVADQAPGCPQLATAKESDENSGRCPGWFATYHATRARENSAYRRTKLPPPFGAPSPPSLAFDLRLRLDVRGLGNLHHSPSKREEDDMERRDFLKIALGAAGGAAALAATAQAAPLSPHPLVEEGRQSATQDAPSRRHQRERGRPGLARGGALVATALAPPPRPPLAPRPPPGRPLIAGPRRAHPGAARVFSIPGRSIL
jgi:hypothetical protein